MTFLWNLWSKVSEGFFSELRIFTMIYLLICVYQLVLGVSVSLRCSAVFLQYASLIFSHKKVHQGNKLLQQRGEQIVRRTRRLRLNTKKNTTYRVITGLNFFQAYYDFWGFLMLVILDVESLDSFRVLSCVD